MVYVYLYMIIDDNNKCRIADSLLWSRQVQVLARNSNWDLSFSHYNHSFAKMATKYCTLSIDRLRVANFPTGSQ